MDLGKYNTAVSTTKSGVLCMYDKINTFCYVFKFKKNGDHRPAPVCLPLASQIPSTKMALLLFYILAWKAEF